MALHIPKLVDRPSKWSSSDPWKALKQAPGAYPSSPQPSHHLDAGGQPSLMKAVNDRRQDYIRKKNVKIKVGTWNVASISSTYKDLAAWFLQGLGVKGLKQDLSGLSATDESDVSSDENIESIEEQERRSAVGKKQSTVPVGEKAAILSDDNIGIYVLGLQEIVDIASLTETLKPFYDPNPAKKWKRAIKRGLPYGYVKIAEQQLLGLLILVYAAPEVAAEITSADSTSVGTGALGYMGNKGAVSTRIVLGGTTRILFVNCHLAAGADEDALNRRIWDTNQILSRTKFNPATIDGDVNPAAHESIGDEDFAFWFGDLNYRLENIPGEDVRRLLLLHTRNEYDVHNKSRMKIDSELGYIDAMSNLGVNETDDGHRLSSSSSSGRPAKDSTAEPPLDPKDDPASLITTINSLLKHDQLRAQQRLQKAFHDGWREGEIDFLPTYKYDVGSVGMFDSGEKKRSPSWCDRILYRTKRDRSEYETQAQQRAKSRRQDEEMQAQGLDKDVADEEVLFDYDPDTDGADDDDEYDDNEDGHDAPSIATADTLPDSITLEKYISHQRVLSSDHKPLSAVFSLNYDAIIPELKAQVQHEVARVLDKNENETRPSITMVIDNPIEGSANADRQSGTSELNSVEFDELRYLVTKTRTLTIANTGPIPAVFAFIDRPVEEGQEKGQFPSWMNIEVHHESQIGPRVIDDLGVSKRFNLSPGDVAMVDITISITNPELVRALNDGATKIENVLILRVLHGRDYFIPIRGSWCTTSFYRSLDELVRFPKGVRSKPETLADSTNNVRQTSEPYHSAPKELFELTELLPSYVERAVADWMMTNHESTPPWVTNMAWPFAGHIWTAHGQDQLTHLAEIREALDTAAPIVEHLDERLSPLARVELLANSLVSFLSSLQDGVIPSLAWLTIEEKLMAIEKSKGAHDYFAVEELVMESLSTTPIHSVSLTFITFMMTRIIVEISSITMDTAQQPSIPLSRRGRSSTEISETPSELSIKSNESSSTISSFLPSLGWRKATVSPPTATAQSSIDSQHDRTASYRTAYADFWANIIIRSERDMLVKGKDKKLLDARKRRVMESLLDSPSV